MDGIEIMGVAEKPKRPLLLSVIGALVIVVSTSVLVTDLISGINGLYGLSGFLLNALNILAGVGFLVGRRWSRGLFLAIFAAVLVTDILAAALYPITIAAYGLRALIIVYLYLGAPNRYFRGMEQQRKDLAGK